jgi:hypothetical protein
VLSVSGGGRLQEREQVSGVLLHCSMEALAGLRVAKQLHIRRVTLRDPRVGVR